MPKQQLNYKFVDAATCTDGKRIDYWDTGKKGLLFRVTKTGVKTFAFRYRVNGKKKYITIGNYPDIGLGDARAKVDELRTQIRKGEDPVYEALIDRRDPEAYTVNQLAESFIRIHVSQLKASTQKSYSHRINKIIIPEFGVYQLKDLERMHIIEFLEEMAFNDGQHVNANRVRAIFSSMISFAVDRGLIDYNIFKLVRKVGKEIKRRRFLTDDEIRFVWMAIEEQAEPARSFIKLLLLTGQRSGETMRMKWKDLKNDIWTIPGTETKNSEVHTVPLNPMALEIIEGIRPYSGGSEYVFESHFYPGRNMKSAYGALKNIVRLSGVDFKIHDLRRTAATGMSKQEVDWVTIGNVLNHKALSMDSTVTATYVRNDFNKEKRLALLKWERHLEQVISGRPAEIIQMGR